ncbi:alpha/beta hydrolase [Oceanicaulis sp. LC35]|uniref:alpha/beta hydrolase n=1 Tax=Oceanicaulis sp. LC35 TaxID=3349635 RepID=UPI003F8604F8
MKLGRYIGLGLLALVLIYLGIASYMVLTRTHDPFAEHPISEEAWRGIQAYGGTSFSQDVPYETRTVSARDGVELDLRVYGPQGDTQIVFLHGVNSNASQLNHAAGLLQAATGAQVITPDARGHGASGGEPYRVDHIGQYEEDVADILAALRAEAPEGRVFLAGHSMGGGVVLRSVMLGDRPDVDGYVLFAPNFGDGPTRHAPREEEDRPRDRDAANGWIVFDSKAFIGVLMYNMLGITAANDTPVLYFNDPQGGADYSYAAVMSAQPTVPRDAPKALSELDAPLLVMIGSHDEVFNAGAYPDFVAEHAGAESDVVIVHELNHNRLINDPLVMARAADWIARH